MLSDAEKEFRVQLFSQKYLSDLHELTGNVSITNEESYKKYKTESTRRWDIAAYIYDVSANAENLTESEVSHHVDMIKRKLLISPVEDIPPDLSRIANELFAPTNRELIEIERNWDIARSAGYNTVGSLLLSAGVVPVGAGLLAASVAVQMDGIQTEFKYRDGVDILDTLNNRTAASLHKLMTDNVVAQTLVQESGVSLVLNTETLDKSIVDQIETLPDDLQSVYKEAYSILNRSDDVNAVISEFRNSLDNHATLASENMNKYFSLALEEARMKEQGRNEIAEKIRKQMAENHRDQRRYKLEIDAAVKLSSMIAGQLLNPKAESMITTAYSSFQEIQKLNELYSAKKIGVLALSTGYVGVAIAVAGMFAQEEEDSSYERQVMEALQAIQQTLQTIQKSIIDLHKYTHERFNEVANTQRVILNSIQDGIERIINNLLINHFEVMRVVNKIEKDIGFLSVLLTDTAYRQDQQLLMGHLQQVQIANRKADLSLADKEDVEKALAFLLNRIHNTGSMIFGNLYTSNNYDHWNSEFLIDTLNPAKISNIEQKIGVLPLIAENMNAVLATRNLPNIKEYTIGLKVLADTICRYPNIARHVITKYDYKSIEYEASRYHRSILSCLHPDSISTLVESYVAILRKLVSQSFEYAYDQKIGEINNGDGPPIGLYPFPVHFANPNVPFEKTQYTLPTFNSSFVNKLPKKSISFDDETGVFSREQFNNIFTHALVNHVGTYSNSGITYESSDNSRVTARRGHSRGRNTHLFAIDKNISISIEDSFYPPYDVFTYAQQFSLVHLIQGEEKTRDVLKVKEVHRTIEYITNRTGGGEKITHRSVDKTVLQECVTTTAIQFIQGPPGIRGKLLGNNHDYGIETIKLKSSSTAPSQGQEDVLPGYLKCLSSNLVGYTFKDHPPLKNSESFLKVLHKELYAHHNNSRNEVISGALGLLEGTPLNYGANKGDQIYANSVLASMKELSAISRSINYLAGLSALLHGLNNDASTSIARATNNIFGDSLAIKEYSSFVLNQPLDDAQYYEKTLPRGIKRPRCLKDYLSYTIIKKGTALVNSYKKIAFGQTNIENLSTPFMQTQLLARAARLLQEDVTSEENDKNEYGVTLTTD